MKNQVCIPTELVGSVIRAVTWVGTAEDWKALEGWAARAGIAHVAEVLATCEAAVCTPGGRVPLSRGAWSLYLANPDPGAASRSGVSSK